MKSTRLPKNGPLGVGRVVALGQVARGLDELEPDDLQAALLIARQDPPDEQALDAVGLDEDEGSFRGWHDYLLRGGSGGAVWYRGVRVGRGGSSAVGAGGQRSGGAGGSSAAAAAA